MNREDLDSKALISALLGWLIVWVQRNEFETKIVTKTLRLSSLVTFWQGRLSSYIDPPSGFDCSDSEQNVSHHDQISEYLLIFEGCALTEKVDPAYKQEKEFIPPM